MTKEELLAIINKAEEENRPLTAEEKALIDQALSEEKSEEETPASGETVEEKAEEEETSGETKEEKAEEETPASGETQEEKSEQEEEPKKEEETRNNKVINNTLKMEKRFNLMKELRNALQTGKSFNLPLESRAYTVTAEGEDVVATDIYDIWEPLRAKNVLVQAGAKTITGIKNNVQIPLMSAVSCSFAGETDAAQDGSGSFSNKKLTPKRITAKYPVSLELIAQDSIGVENAIRNDIMKAVNSKLEATILGAAAGTTDKPAGIFYGASADTVTAFSGITGLEAEVEVENYDLGTCKYIVSPAAKASLRNMAKSAKSTQLVMEGGEIDGTPVLTTSHVPAKKFAYGDWSNLVIATWDNVQIDVVRDVASVGNGVVTIVVNAFVDAALIRDNAIAFGQVQ